MKTLLRPYEGTLPYLFVSYAHKNDAAVLEIISTLPNILPISAQGPDIYD